jgi:predicted MPP superfamily phosphohydrolase
MSAEWMLIAAAAVWTWTNLIEPFHLRLRERSWTLPHLSPALDGLTILHLSDLHIRKMGFLERKLARLLSQTSAHIAVLTGDLVDSDRGIVPLVEILSRVRTTLGVYAVWGNSEHKPSRLSHTDRLEHALREAGVNILNNEARMVQYHGASIWLGGVDDPHSGFANLPAVISSLSRADLYLLLAHSPDILMETLTARFDLILCGHTHCGQIRVPRWGALWSHARLGRWVGEPVLYPDYIARHLKRPLPQPHVAVSPGVATVGVPLFKARLFCPPEVTLHVLRSTAFAPAHASARISPPQET